MVCRKSDSAKVYKIVTADLNTSLYWIPEAYQEIEKGRFTGACLTQNGHPSTLFDVQIKSFKNPWIGIPITEINAVEVNMEVLPRSA